MINYFGFNLNEPNDPAPWALREQTVFQDVVRMLGPALDYPGIGVVSAPRMYDMVFGIKADGSLPSIGMGMANTDVVRCPLDIVMTDSGYAGALTADTAICLETSSTITVQVLMPAGGATALWIGTAADIDHNSLVWNDADNSLAIIAGAGAGYAGMNISPSGISLGFATAAMFPVHAQADAMQVFICQDGAASAVANIALRQDDDDYAFIDFDGTLGDGKSIENHANVGTFMQRRIKVRFNDAGGSGWNVAYIPLYDLL